MSPLRQTLFHGRHVDLGAKLVEFAGWEMPLQYPTGIITEHLATRRHAGLFDVSHMGRFVVRGPEALPFLQHVLSNNAAALDVGMAQYTIIPTRRRRRPGRRLPLPFRRRRVRARGQRRQPGPGLGALRPAPARLSPASSS